MITLAINILIYTAIFLIIGLIKPDWALFFMKQPSRAIVIILCIVLFMVAATLFGEGARQNKAEQQAAEFKERIQSSPSSPAPVPVPK